MAMMMMYDDGDDCDGDDDNGYAYDDNAYTNNKHADNADGNLMMMTNAG